MKKYLTWILCILAIVVSIYGVNAWWNSIIKRNNEETAQQQKIIEDCLKRPDRKIETVGSPWIKQFLVCNPK